jgi:hypothetical protein
MVIQLVNKDLVRQIEQIAEQEQRALEQIVAEALEMYLAQPRKISGVSFLLSIAGQGASSEDDVSERDEEILAAEVDPIRGWHVERFGEDSA